MAHTTKNGLKLHWVKLHPTASNDELRRQASILLEDEWPTAGGIQGRQRQLLRSSSSEVPASFVVTTTSSSSTSTMNSTQKLSPLSASLTQDEEDEKGDEDNVRSEVIGYVCLKPASELPDGLSSLVYSVLVRKFTNNIFFFNFLKKNL